MADRVVVIGGGASGALIAARLAERGFAVTLVEKAAIGNGSSSRSNAGIRAQFGVIETIVGMMYSEWWYTHIHEHLKTPPDQRQPAIQPNGYLFLYEDPAQAGADWEPELRASAAAAWRHAHHCVEMQRSIGLPVEILPPGEIKARWPFLLAERLVGATWCPTDGYLYPAVIYGEGVRRARDLGANIVPQCEVIGGRCRHGRLVSVETTKGEFEADWFVNATNAWAPRVSRRLGGMRVRIEPLKRYLYHLRPNPGQAPIPADAWERLPMTICGMGRSQRAITRPDGQNLIITTSHPQAPEPDFTDNDQDRIDAAYDHRNGVDNYGFALLNELARFAPDLAECGGLVATTGGYYGMSPDGNPSIGYDLNHANLVHAAGFSGHGLMHAPITAVLVEALVTGAIENGRVRLPEPYPNHFIDLAAFDPARDFNQTTHESHVL